MQDDAHENMAVVITPRGPHPDHPGTTDADNGMDTDAEDDDMPPLVDIPPPMTYTFATTMTPSTYGSATTVTADAEGIPGTEDADADVDFTSPTYDFFPTDSSPSGEYDYTLDVDNTTTADPPLSPFLNPSPTEGGSRPHDKKHRSSLSSSLVSSHPSTYIPRPPNAFILFRSSFVRAQRVPGRIEGNHSTLSKIVGMCWKGLSRDERGIWEERARVAQAEHRRRYPDWRFRMSGNRGRGVGGGMGLGRGTGVRDGGGGTNGLGTKVRVKEKEKERDQDKDHDRDRDKEREREQLRCEKIVDLLADGMEGSELATAIDVYDREVLLRDESSADERQPRDPSPRGSSSSTNSTHPTKKSSARSQTHSIQRPSKSRKRPSFISKSTSDSLAVVHPNPTPNLNPNSSISDTPSFNFPIQTPQSNPNIPSLEGDSYFFTDHDSTNINYHIVGEHWQDREAGEHGEGRDEDKRFAIPLTAMFKRSSSAPAAPDRIPFTPFYSTFPSPSITSFSAYQYSNPYSTSASFTSVNPYSTTNVYENSFAEAGLGLPAWSSSLVFDSDELDVGMDGGDRSDGNEVGGYGRTRRMIKSEGEREGEDAPEPEAVERKHDDTNEAQHQELVEGSGSERALIPFPIINQSSSSSQTRDNGDGNMDRTIQPLRAPHQHLAHARRHSVAHPYHNSHSVDPPGHHPHSRPYSHTHSHSQSYTNVASSRRNLPWRETERPRAGLVMAGPPPAAASGPGSSYTQPPQSPVSAPAYYPHASASYPQQPLYVPHMPSPLSSPQFAPQTQSRTQAQHIAGWHPPMVPPRHGDAVQIVQNETSSSTSSWHPPLVVPPYAQPAQLNERISPFAHEVAQMSFVYPGGSQQGQTYDPVQGQGQMQVPQDSILVSNTQPIPIPGTPRLSSYSSLQGWAGADSSGFDTATYTTGTSPMTTTSMSVTGGTPSPSLSMMPDDISTVSPFSEPITPGPFAVYSSTNVYEYDRNNNNNRFRFDGHEGGHSDTKEYQYNSSSITGQPSSSGFQNVVDMATPMSIQTPSLIPMQITSPASSTSRMSPVVNPSKAPYTQSPPFTMHAVQSPPATPFDVPNPFGIAYPNSLLSTDINDVSGSNLVSFNSKPDPVENAMVSHSDSNSNAEFSFLYDYDVHG